MGSDAPLYPIALDLRGKPVLVVGAGRLAARKIPELLRCGAEITVVAPVIHESVRRFAKSLALRERFFRDEDIEKPLLVFTLTPDAELNRRIGELCREKGCLCNRADEGKQGDFQVPGVVRRGSVTLTAATNGKAPGLTRLLKQRLESLFGAELLLLAEALGDWRTKQKSRLSQEAWRENLERLPYLELWQAAKKGKDELLLALENLSASWDTRPPVSLVPAGGLAEAGKGRPVPSPVLLIGAGPGHPGLITVLAQEEIRKAQIILHDRLIPPEILDWAAEDCECIPVEKRGHQPSMRQEQINALLIRKAGEGKRVVRLKGGDPFVFGRGYEEIIALEACGLPWRVVPGLSTATSVPGWAGIPLTHRGMARSFAVMTGTSYDQPGVEIPKADTIVVLMGLHRLPAILRAFRDQGYAGDTPALAIEKGTREDQRVCHGDLETLEALVAEQGFDSPALIVVGRVAGLGR